MASSPRRTVVCAALLVIATMAVYLPSLHGGFIWDDDTLITQNSAVKSADGLYSIWFTSWSGDYVPLTSFLFWIEWHLWQGNACGFHAVNILLHAANVVLLWRVLLRLGIPGAFLGALLFAIHPVCAASVTWVAETKNTLSMLFYLGSVLLFLDYDESRSASKNGNEAVAGKRERRLFFSALILFALGLLAKSAVAVLPMVLLLCAWWRRKRLDRADFVACGPFFALAVVFSLLAIWIQRTAIHSGMPHPADNLWTRLIAGGWALWFYLGKIIAPVNLAMIYPRLHVDPSSPLSLFPGIAFPALLLLFWRKRETWGGGLFFAFAYYGIALGPVLGFVDMVFFSNSQVADHFQYLAIPGILALIAAGVAKIGRQNLCDSRDDGSRFPDWITRARFSRTVGAVGIITGAWVWLLTSQTQQRELVLRDSLTLWEDNAAKNTNSWRVYMNLNMALLEHGRTNEAIQMYDRAMVLFSDKKK
jgi:hypothetical protein